MRILYYFFLLFTIIHINCIGQTIETNQQDKSRHERWIEDLKYFDNEFLEKSETYSADSLFACKKRLSVLELLIDSLNDNQINLELSRCVAMANNGHTKIYLGWMNKIPLRFFWFSDGLFVIKATEPFSEYMGTKVIQINNIPVEYVSDKINPYISGNENWKRYIGTNHLCSPQFLSGLNISSEDSLSVTLVKDNDTIELNLGVFDSKNNIDKYDAFYNLYPTDSSNTEWFNVLYRNNNLPLYLQHSDKGAFYKFLTQNKLAYFNLNSTWDRGVDLRGLVNEFLDSLQKKPDYSVILDLRFNTGGNFMLPTKLAKKTPKLINANSKIYLITSNMTFSAGLITAARVKYFAKEKICVVGEQVGDNLKFRAEGISYILPNSKIKIQDSKYEHDWINDKFIPFRTYFFNLFLGVPAKNLDVDKEIKLSSKDYLNYQDPIMDWILEQ